MTILFVLEHFHPYIGGAAVLFSELTRALVQRGHAVTVITSRLPGTHPEEDWHGVQVVRVATPLRGDRYWFTLGAVPAVVRAAKRADLVHTTTYNATAPAWLAAKLWRKPILLSVLEIFGPRWHTYPLARPVAALYRGLEWLIGSMPYHALVAISEATARDLERLRGSDRNIHVIHCGIDEALFARRERPTPSADAFRFLYFGRPGISKGVEYLVEAMATLAQREARARLDLILSADPPGRRAALIEQIAAAGIGHRVTVREPVSRTELPGEIAAADAVVVPSLAEGFGFSAAEACAVGTPVVATTAGSLPEVVSGNVVLVPPGDATALASGMQQMMTGQSQLMPERSFRWETAAARYETLYQELVA
ncbi:glycosyltransferase family 4 protein [Candidatus Berkelbacteria bacterium]|nr:glycosyltransferase family 4 protein [Candidatus Berkelbacteria bacterium]